MTLSSDLYPRLFLLNGRTKNLYEKLTEKERKALDKELIKDVRQKVRYAYNRHVAKLKMKENP